MLHDTNGESAKVAKHRAKRRLIKSARGASDYFDGAVSERAIYHLVETGRIPVIKMGKALYFDADDLDAAFRSAASNG